MTAPIDRDRQIDLMKTAAERAEARAQTWERVPAIRDAFKRPAPGQETGNYRRHTVKLAR